MTFEQIKAILNEGQRQDLLDDWRIDYNEDKTITFGRYTSTGEDWYFSISPTDKTLCEQLYDWIMDFDINEDVYMWLEAKSNGVAGVPDVELLVESAKEKQAFVEELREILLPIEHSNN